jgi:hypothetical protein
MMYNIDVRWGRLKAEISRGVRLCPLEPV